jgi:hypothetical protein
VTQYSLARDPMGPGTSGRIWPAAPTLIDDLERGGALTSYQARLLRESRPDLGDDWATSPYFGTVREHSRAYIDQARCSTRATDAAGERGRAVAGGLQ